MSLLEDQLRVFLESLKADKAIFEEEPNIPYARGVATGYERSIRFLEYVLEANNGEDQD